MPKGPERSGQGYKDDKVPLSPKTKKRTVSTVRFFVFGVIHIDVRRTFGIPLIAKQKKHIN